MNRTTVRVAVVTAAILASGISDANELPDLTSKLHKGLCANGPGEEGADSFYTGQFAIDGKTVTGTEKWLLFTNPKWRAKGGRDCSIEWKLTGTVTEPGRCTSCDFGIKYHAVANVEGSNCPEELVKGRLLPDGSRAGGEAQNFDNSYSIKKNSDGTTHVYSSRSGKRVGKGYFVGNAYNWISSHGCKWF